MKVKEAYNIWADQYDTNENKTRDLEATGSKARFETEGGLNILTCFDHHIFDFTNTAKRHGFQISDFIEYFDNSDRTGIPRILTLLLKK